MIYFVEPFIENKIKLAEYLYITNGALDIENIQSELKISKSTIERYVKELEESYSIHFVSGNRYNTITLQHIIRELLDQSALLALFKEIVFNLGNPSAFYKEKLLLSPATFARLITQLKKQFKDFNMSIVIDNGYWVESTSEYEFICLIAGIMHLFKTDRSDLFESLTVVESKCYQEKKQHDLYAMNSFERSILDNIFLMTLIRVKQRTAAQQLDKRITLEEMKKHLIQVYDQNWLDTYDIYTERISIMYHHKIEASQRKKLVEVLVRVNFYSRLLPYSLEVLDLKQDFFVRKMYAERPKREKTLEKFLSRLSSLLETNFCLRKNSLIYHIVSANILLFEYERKFQLAVHSNLGSQHEDFFIDTLQPVHLYLKNMTQLGRLSDQMQVTSNNPVETIVLTNERLDKAIFPNQYLVSDFLTLTEFTEFISWLKLSTETTVTY